MTVFAADRLTLADETVQLHPGEAQVIVRPMLTVSKAVDLYLGDISRRGYSQATQKTYAGILDKLCDRLPDDHDVSKITTDDIRRFLDQISHRAKGTQAHRESVVASFTRWLYLDGKIARDPMDRLARTKRIPAQDLDVLTVSTADVQRLILHAETWPERLAIGILVYLGPRRKAVSRLRLSDYDRARSRIRFQEKGGKTIWKPVPDELDRLLENAIAAGILTEPDDYLVPNEGYLTKKGERDDRVIWRLVKDVARKAGVETHVHALRAAFACFYLEANPGDVEALRELLGHRSLTTTQTYLRRLDKETAMERVRPLSWGVSLTDNDGGGEPAAKSDKTVVGAVFMGAGGFEPPCSESTASERATPTTKPDEHPMKEIVVLGPDESRLQELRQRLASEGITAELGFRLAGLTEGEGCFSLSQSNNAGWRGLFIIKLRADDRPILDDLAAATGIGKVRDVRSPSRHNPCATWVVERKAECLRLADIFAAYPLRSKKRRDCLIWSEAIEIWQFIQKGPDEDWSRIADLARQLRETRQYIEPGRRP